MGNYQFKHALTACLIVVMAMAVGSSCSENDADEMPTTQTADITPLQTAGSADGLFAGISISEVGKKIPNETAKRWIKNHDASTTNGITHHVFGKNVINSMLSDPKAEGIRLCYAVDDTGTPIIVIQSIDSQNNVLEDADMSIHCPPLCPDATN